MTEAATILRGWPDGDGWSFEQPAAPDAVTAASVPASPPAEWFDYHDFPDGTPLTFDESGQVYGLLASRKIPHVGLPGQNRYAPYSNTDYAWFRTGQVRCSDGTLVSTGRITMSAPHADGNADMQAASAHYDHSATAVADVVAFDRPDGVYCCGAARPELTPAQMRMAMASPPSGDWRPSPDGKPGLEMCAALLVNTAGFPQPRLALAASGEVLSLVAAGVPLPRVPHAPTPTQEPPMPEQDPTTADTPESLVAASPFAKPDDAPEPADGGDGEDSAFGEGESALISGTNIVVQITGEADDGGLEFAGVLPADALEAADEAVAASAAQRFTDGMRDRARDRDIAKLTDAVSSLAASAQAAQESASAQTAKLDEVLAKQRADEAERLIASAEL